MLKINEKLKIFGTNNFCTIKEYIGSGGQGEVYKVKVDNETFALKWYISDKIIPHQKNIIKNLINQKSTMDKRFLCPLNLVETSNSFGYLMELIGEYFKSIEGLISGKIEPNFWSLFKIGYNLADAFYNLHTKGYAYQDISPGNIFINPDNGDVLICDTDNIVVINSEMSSIIGTSRFMAPEIILGKRIADAETDRYSLAILLFEIFFWGHPLDGKKKHAINCFNYIAIKEIYGRNPVFIFDPDNDTNRLVVEGIHDNPIIYWKLYPEFFKNLFITAFTKGIKNRDERIREGEWRKAFIELQNSIIYCQECNTENLYDKEKLVKKQPIYCWNRECGINISLPCRIKINDSVIMLNLGTKLYPHHLESKLHGKLHDFSQELAIVVKHPKKNVLGLKNNSERSWIGTLFDGTTKTIEKGKSASLGGNFKSIDFGTSMGDLRYG